MQAKINSQVALLNAVAMGALEAPVNPNDAAHLEALKEKLKTVSAQLNDSPDDKPLTAMRDQLRGEIADCKRQCRQRRRCPAAGRGGGGGRQVRRSAG